MLGHHAYCLDRAADARADAKAATLGNVRDRWLRCEQSWRQMASRAADSDDMRARIVADKVAERAAVTASILLV
jgi:hypothetical protein